MFHLVKLSFIIYPNTNAVYRNNLFALLLMDDWIVAPSYIGQTVKDSATSMPVEDPVSRFRRVTATS